MKKYIAIIILLIAVTAYAFPPTPPTVNITGNAATATELASNPTDCGANAVATAIDASGNLTCGYALNADIQAYDADLDTWAGVTPGANVTTLLATPSSANLANAITGETGSGALVFATSPTLVTPTLGAASATTIGFPASQSASSDVNVLDDYEEGTWVVTLYDAYSAGNASPTTGTGYYVKIGKVVICYFAITNINTTGMTAGNNLYFNLPFAASTGGSTIGSVIYNAIALSTGYTQLNIAPYYANSGYGAFYESGSTKDAALVKVSAITSGTSDIVRATFIYFSS